MGLYFKFSIFMSLHPTIQQQLISANTDSHLWSFQSSPFLHPLLNFSHLPVFPFWHKCNQLAVPKAKGGFCILSRTYIFLKEEIITHTKKTISGSSVQTTQIYSVPCIWFRARAQLHSHCTKSTIMSFPTLQGSMG